MKPRWPAGARPDLHSDGFTTFASADARTQLAIGSRPVEVGTTLARWQRQLEAADELDYPVCERVKPATPTTLDGVPTARRWLSCASVGAAGDLMLTTARNRGWAVLCSVSTPDEASTHRACEGLLEDFHFQA